MNARWGDRRADWLGQPTQGVEVGGLDEERGERVVQSGDEESCANVSDGLRPGCTLTTTTRRDGETVREERTDLDLIARW